MAAPAKIILKSSTKVSLNDRFTNIMRTRPVSGASVRAQVANDRLASEKNRRLAQQMERRPTVAAELGDKPVSIQDRLGQRTRGRGRVMRGRFPSRGRGRGRISTFSRVGRGQSRVLRGNSRGRFNRGRGSSRGRGFGNTNRLNRGRGGMRGRGRGGGRGRGARGGGQPAANKNTLDEQLDSYMSKTKGSMDAELDSYMAEINP